MLYRGPEQGSDQPARMSRAACLYRCFVYSLFCFGLCPADLAASAVPVERAHHIRLRLRRIFSNPERPFSVFERRLACGRLGRQPRCLQRAVRVRSPAAARWGQRALWSAFLKLLAGCHTSEAGLRATTDEHRWTQMAEAAPASVCYYRSDSCTFTTILEGPILWSQSAQRSDQRSQSRHLCSLAPWPPSSLRDLCVSPKTSFGCGRGSRWVDPCSSVVEFGLENSTYPQRILRFKKLVPPVDCPRASGMYLICI